MILYSCILHTKWSIRNVCCAIPSNHYFSLRHTFSAAHSTRSRDFAALALWVALLALLPPLLLLVCPLPVDFQTASSAVALRVLLLLLPLLERYMAGSAAELCAKLEAQEELEVLCCCSL